MPRSRSTFIQSLVARRRSPRALTASGCAMIANVRRFAMAVGSSDMTAESTQPRPARQPERGREADARPRRGPPRSGGEGLREARTLLELEPAVGAGTLDQRRRR